MQEASVQSSYALISKVIYSLENVEVKNRSDRRIEKHWLPVLGHINPWCVSVPLSSVLLMLASQSCCSVTERKKKNSSLGRMLGCDDVHQVLRLQPLGAFGCLHKTELWTSQASLKTAVDCHGKVFLPLSSLPVLFLKWNQHRSRTHLIIKTDISVVSAASDWNSLSYAANAMM